MSDEFIPDDTNIIVADQWKNFMPKFKALTAHSRDDYVPMTLWKNIKQLKIAAIVKRR